MTTLPALPPLDPAMNIVESPSRKRIRAKSADVDLACDGNVYDEQPEGTQ